MFVCVMRAGEGASATQPDAASHMPDTASTVLLQHARQSKVRIQVLHRQCLWTVVDRRGAGLACPPSAAVWAAEPNSRYLDGDVNASILRNAAGSSSASLVEVGSSRHDLSCCDREMYLSGSRQSPAWPIIFCRPGTRQAMR